MNQTAISRRRHLGIQAGLVASLMTTRNGLAQTASGSFMADPNSLKSSIVQISSEGSAGIGFIAEQDGQHYIFTNASVISGHNKLVFQTLDNKAVQPKKIELSATRDLVRILVAGETALKLNPAIVINERISVLECKNGTLENHVGVITGSSKDMIEIDAAFGKNSSGSPLLDSAFNVHGIANQLIYYKANGTAWEGTPRRFAYKLDDADWYAASWTRYNKTYGKSLREIDEFRTTVYAMAQNWIKEPKREIESDESAGLDFDRWVKSYNDMISDLGKKQGKGGSGDANAKIQKRFQESCSELIGICESKARQLDFLCEDKNITKYLQIQFKWRTLELKKFCRFITDHAENHEQDRWM